MTSSSGSCVVVLGTPPTPEDPKGAAQGWGGTGPGLAIAGGATPAMERMVEERADGVDGAGRAAAAKDLSRGASFPHAASVAAGSVEVSGREW